MLSNFCGKFPVAWSVYWSRAIGPHVAAQGAGNFTDWSFPTESFRATFGVRSPAHSAASNSAHLPQKRTATLLLLML